MKNKSKGKKMRMKYVKRHIGEYLLRLLTKIGSKQKWKKKSSRRGKNKF